MKKTFFSLLSASVLFISCTQKQEKPEPSPAAPPAGGQFPSGSIYQLKGAWTNQEGKTVTLADFRGKAMVVAMVFTHCRYACPKRVADLKNIEAAIPPGKKDRLGFLLISFDTERDSVQRLKEFYDEMQMNKNWTLLRGDEQQVRELSVLLNVQYEKQPDGNFSHSNSLTVLNADGSIAFQHEGIGLDPQPVVNEINQLVP